MPPLIFAGLRYFLGFLLLVPLVLKADRKAIQGLTRIQWGELCALGIVMYGVTQGSQFLSLAYFPAVLIALILNFTPIAVAILSFFLLREGPTRLQILGILVCAIGACLYFVPHLAGDIPVSWLLLIPIVGTLSNAGASILGRAINRREHLQPRVVTVISMGVGSLILLLVGIVTEKMPDLGFRQILIIVWLAVVNTAFAFTLWNHTLRTLTSVESSVINNTMMIQIAVLSVVFMGESLNAIDVVGLTVASLGALLVQVKRKSAG